MGDNTSANGSVGAIPTPNLNTGENSAPSAQSAAATKAMIASVVSDAPPAQQEAVSELGELLNNNNSTQSTDDTAAALGLASPTPVSPQVVTQDAATQSPSTGQSSSNQLPAVTQPVDGQTAQTDLSEVDLLRQQNAQLWTRIEQISQQLLGGQSQGQVSQTQPQNPSSALPPNNANDEVVFPAPVIPVNRNTPPTPTPQGQPVAKQTFITQEEFVRSFESAESFNTLLNKVYEAATQGAMARTMPLVDGVAQEAVRRYTLGKDFYAANPALTPYKATVGFLCNTVKAQNPAFTDEQVLAQVAVEANKMLAAGILTNPNGTVPPTAPSRPGLPIVNGARQPVKPAQSKQQQLINSVIG